MYCVTTHTIENEEFKMKDSRKIRFFDKYIGTFICFIFSLIAAIKIKRKNTQVKNILVMELFEMGAATMAYSSIAYIKNKIKDSNIYCLTLKSMKESWELLDIIPEKNIYTIDDRNLMTFFFSLCSQIIKLRSKKIDMLIDYELFMRIPAIIAFLIKTKHRSGFNRYEMEGLYRGSFYDFNCMFNQNMHIARNFLALTKTAIELRQDYPNYKDKTESSEITSPHYSSDEKLNKVIKEKITNEYAEYNGQKIILVNPDVGMTLSLRNYPKDNYVQIIKKVLGEYPTHLVALVGVKDNIPVCDHIHKKVNNKRCINLCAKTKNLRELFEMLSIAELLISNDSGMPHFAASTGTKTITIFGPETPRMYGPIGKAVAIYNDYHCSPCLSAYNHKLSKCTNNMCIKTISHETVFETIKRVLENNIEYQTINTKIKYI